MIPWESFRRQLVERVGEKRCQSIFCELTGIESSVMYRWKANDAVPDSAITALLAMDITTLDNERFKGFHTKRFFNRVVELSNAKVPIKNISVIMTAELGRKVTDGSVKSARFKMKDRITGYRTRA